MTYLMILVLFGNASSDTLLLQTKTPNQDNYTKKVLINGLVGIGFGVGTGVFYTLGNNAFEDYEDSDSIRTSLDNWNKTKLYDNLRNVCAVGAAIFTLRALYYQLKHVKASKSSKNTPILDFQYSCRDKWSLGIKTVF
jgi:hypothetical protein